MTILTPQLNILVIGKTGQLGRALGAFNSLDDVRVQSFGRENVDLSRADDALRACLQKLPEADVYVLAAAYTAVDKAETEPELARHVNQKATATIARHCAERGIPLIYVSTDYVFDGNQTTPYAPSDACCPINVYGETKRGGERALLAQKDLRGAILRTSWVYDAEGKNFFTTMIRLAQTRDALDIVSDQFGRPTYAPDLAQAVLLAARRLAAQTPPSKGNATGTGKNTRIYHFSNSGPRLSWADFAKAIFKATDDLRPHSVRVNPISGDDYLSAAERPSNSVMDISDFERDHSWEAPHWESGLERALRSYRTINKCPAKKDAL